MLPVHKFVEIIVDPWRQRMAYATGRDMVEDVTGGESNACAAVCSLWNIMRGALSRVYYNTGDLYKALLAAGVDERHEASEWRDARPGDIGFSNDVNPKNGMPDHTFVIFSKPDNDGYCLVLDNYEPVPHRRNLLEGERTPLAFFLRDNTPIKRISPWQKRVVMMGFSWLYSQFSAYPMYIRQQLNALRHDVFFE